MSEHRKLPAPAVSQPTRAASPDQARSFGDARGSHRGNTTTQKVRKDDARCWYEGYRAGRRGEPMRANPYPTGTVESWSWVGGHIEGKDRRDKDHAALDAIREH